jgi:DNA polymerase-3 subunit epsilon
VNFVVVDVETANSDLSSICQIGIASFSEGVLHGTWKSLVNPEDEFDPINISIHGIDEHKVQFSPNWRGVYPQVRCLLQGNIVVSHTAFDRVALGRACEKSNLAQCDFKWLDSAKVVRRAWPMFSKCGYGLENVATNLRIQYKQHDALEDARCAGEILLRAITETGLSVEQWLELVKKPLSPSTALPITRGGHPDGPLFGEVLVFTGSLSMPRRRAADAASAVGCEVDARITERTSLLVVGDQDIRKLAGHTKSAKRRKAEERIARGQRIRIISETDFHRIIRQ